MPRAGFEPTISAGERLQNYALDHAATSTGIKSIRIINKLISADNIGSCNRHSGGNVPLTATLYTVGSRFTTGLRSRIFGCKPNCRKTSNI